MPPGWTNHRDHCRGSKACCATAGRTWLRSSLHIRTNQAADSELFQNYVLEAEVLVDLDTDTTPVCFTPWNAVPRVPGYLYIPHSPASKINRFSPRFRDLSSISQHPRICTGSTTNTRSASCAARGCTPDASTCAERGETCARDGCHARDLRKKKVEARFRTGFKKNRVLKRARFQSQLMGNLRIRPKWKCRTAKIWALARLPTGGSWSSASRAASQLPLLWLGPCHPPDAVHTKRS